MEPRIILSILVLSLGSASSAETVGHASCVDFAEGIGCEVKWAFPGARDREYQVQVWNQTAGAWEDTDRKARFEHAGQRVGALPAGHIYRVLACDSRGKCFSSNTVWAPVWDRPENIPDTVRVEGPKGPITFDVTKTDHNGLPHTSSEVVTQYNMYLLHREALSFFDSDAEMPPMVKARMKGEFPDTVEEMVAFNVQQDYELIRTDVLATRRAQKAQ